MLPLGAVQPPFVQQPFCAPAQSLPLDQAAPGGRARCTDHWFRVSGLYVLERMKGEVLSAVAAEHRRAAVERARRAAIRRAAAASSTAAAAAAQGSPHSQVAAEVAAAAAGQPVPAAEEAEAAARAAPTVVGLGGRRHSRVRFDLPEPALEEAGQAAVGRVMLPPTPAGTAASPLGTQLIRGGSLAGGGGQPSTRLPGVQYVPLTEAEVLQQLDQQKLWHSSQALARHVLVELRWAST